MLVFGTFGAVVSASCHDLLHHTQTPLCPVQSSPSRVWLNFLWKISALTFIPNFRRSHRYLPNGVMTVVSRLLSWSSSQCQYPLVGLPLTGLLLLISLAAPHPLSAMGTIIDVDLCLVVSGRCILLATCLSSSGLRFGRTAL